MTQHLQHPGSPFESKVKTDSSRFEKNQSAIANLVGQVRNEEELIQQGGGEKAIAAQHKKGRLTARERIALLIDPAQAFSNSAHLPPGACTKNGVARRRQAS